MQLTKAKLLELATSSKPWENVNSTIHFRHDDSQFWWDRTGRMFAKLLQYAGYNAIEQYRELFFYALFVAPELGPAPDINGNVRRWRSPGTPDSTPIDFSWEFGAGQNAVVRYSFEPIGSDAGTDLDPLNQYASDNWIFRLRQQNMVPGLDLEWYHHFTQSILPHGERPRTTDEFVEETTPKGGTVVALDIEKSGPVMKVYIYPGLKAEELGISNLELVKQSIRSLPIEQYESLNVEPLLAYLDMGTAKYGFETGILGIDCLSPQEARIKIYVRARHTSLEYLMDALTLGGALDLSASDEALADLQDFWQTFLADAPDVLTDDAPGRASPGFYYTVGCGKAVSPKVYISPQYFCKSDADVLARLRRFFSTRRSAPKTDNYEKALRDIL
ncbi:4-O-dimethylallyl-L-tyrosine synthase 1 [Phlyctema vagabunda]|uniref:4-O-dimethylallyl-L-tyrosine synthase 1 n=1 Tax=Phlyctema vagabunda TaxID=108571 RepID=A0ABR4P3I0_9HELO